MIPVTDVLCNKQREDSPQGGNQDERRIKTVGRS